MPARPQENNQQQRRGPPPGDGVALGLASFFVDAMHLPRGPRPRLANDSSSEEYSVDDINVLPFRTVGMGPEPVLRALQLLARVVTPEQRRDLAMFGHFTVHAPGYGEYMILPRSVFNVVDVDSGISYCAGPLMPLPIPDVMLLQKLMLESEPERFFRVANRRQADVARALNLAV